MSDKHHAIYEDAFNMLCGDKIGEGISRIVYNCKIRQDLVAKVEFEDYRYFSNVIEAKFWWDNQYYEKISKWLAPVEFLSPDGRILLQRKATPIPDGYKLPNMLPEFLTDIKRSNFGILEGKLVCLDYALTIKNSSVRLKKANWE